jgi:uncharacterized protein
VKDRKTKYHVIIVAIYIVICSYFYWQGNNSFVNFSFERTHLNPFLLITALTTLSLFIANYFLKFGEFKLKNKTFTQTLLIIFYSFVLIALPEELIFRGFIQGNTQSLNNQITVVLISSLIFGFAHILNGAKGNRPKSWNWKMVIITIILGVYLGALYYVTKSLLLPIILHGLIVVINQLFIREK